MSLGKLLDSRMLGVLLVIQREGVTADPHIEAAVVGLGLAFYQGDKTRLTRSGKAALRAADEHAAGCVADWRCECGDLNRCHEAFCYRCGAGSAEIEATERDR